MILDESIKMKTQGEIMNILSGTGNRLRAVAFGGRNRPKTHHAGAEVYKKIASLGHQ